MKKDMFNMKLDHFQVQTCVDGVSLVFRKYYNINNIIISAQYLFGKKLEISSCLETEIASSESPTHAL